MPGISLLADDPGAVLDVTLSDADAEAVVALYRQQLVRMLDAMGWTTSELTVRRFPGGASLFTTAPADLLYTATEINEWAWAAALTVHGGGVPPALEPGLGALREQEAKERNPALVALRDAALARGVTFATDHKATSIGSGTGVVVFHRGEVLPAPGDVDWARVHDVPILLVTGSNGKTTTVRLLAAIVRAWGKVPGYSSTDAIVLGDDPPETGDWSGPMGARAVLRDNRVEVAILETARGGILRRGLGVSRADAAIVTNVAEDHLGEWGITDLAAIADTKLVVGKVATTLVLNADDARLEAKGDRRQAKVVWFAVDARPAGDCVILDGPDLVSVRGGKRSVIARAADVPITLGGAARYNVANALGAIALAQAIGVPDAVIARGLLHFRSTPAENPGRGHVYDFGGATVIVDFAHNPHGQRALIETARGMPSTRRAIILGQAGDRDDASIRGLARETWPWKPDLVVLKEMEIYLRGRQPGESTGLIHDEFIALGADESMFRRCDTELGAVREALAWARPGDLILLPVHAQRAEVLELMARLEAAGWKAGEPLPS